jgi:trans-aconitate methyltransferase
VAHRVPPNCRFLVEDVNADWLFAERFDLIHSRAMVAGIKGWPRYLAQALTHLKPGGWIELHDAFLPAACTPETTSRLGAEPAFITLTSKFVEYGYQVGLDLQAPAKFADMLRDAGFINVHVQWLKMPIGPWAKGKKNKDIGLWYVLCMLPLPFTCH